MRRIIGALVGLTLAVALAGACSSGGGSSSDSGGGTISKSEFIKKGNALCKSAMQKLDNDAQSQGLDSASTSKQADYIKNKVVPAYEKLLSQLKDLGYPKGDKAKLNSIYSQAEQDIAKFKKDPKAALSGSTESKADQEFYDYGLTECGSNGSDSGGSTGS